MTCKPVSVLLLHNDSNRPNQGAGFQKDRLTPAAQACHRSSTTRCIARAIDAVSPVDPGLLCPSTIHLHIKGLALNRSGFNILRIFTSAHLQGLTIVLIGSHCIHLRYGADEKARRTTMVSHSFNRNSPLLSTLELSTYSRRSKPYAVSDRAILIHPGTLEEGWLRDGTFPVESAGSR